MKNLIIALILLLIPSNLSANTLHNDKSCLADTIYREANGHPQDMKLVGLVIQNRATSLNYSICKTVYQPGQFPSLKRKIKYKDFYKSEQVASNILEGNQEDITKGATYFYNVKTDKPRWKSKTIETFRTENHSYRKHK
jgi:spore germination cell wall hydrolase CwlJ-like protein